MTIRMDRRDTQQGVNVELHGWLNEEVVGDFENLCGPGSGALCLDLTHLVGADEAGLRALRARVTAGARTEGASPYIALLLKSESAVRNPDGAGK